MALVKVDRIEYLDAVTIVFEQLSHAHDVFGIDGGFFGILVVIHCFLLPFFAEPHWVSS